MARDFGRHRRRVGLAALTVAAWLLLDLEAQTAVYRRVEYPVEKTQAEIRERGLPEPLALRLESGV